jgi:hypothetical protein
MKLTYKLLWFDDEPRMVRTSEKRLARMMRGKGFDLEVENRTDISQKSIIKLGADLAQYNPYDLIVFDHELGSRKGTDIARILRQTVFTDMVYYSASPIEVLRKAIFQVEVYGVFLISKTTCVDDLSRILEDHIRKNCDLNSMRGIVLDALAEMEAQLRRHVIATLHNGPESLRQKQLKKLKDRFSDRAKRFDKEAESMTEPAMLSCFANPVKSDFNTVRQTLSSCDKDWENLKENHLLHELQNLRNVLAHESYRWNREDNCVTVRVDGKERRFNSSDFEAIRKKLLTMSKDIADHCGG